MRYERIENLVRIAVRLQGTPGGLTLDDIGADFSVSRRTAERMRHAVGAVFGPLDLVDADDTKRRWRLRSDVVRRLVGVSPKELAELESAAEALERTGIDERAGTLRELATKLRTMLRLESRERLESDFEALMQAEGFAMRGPEAPARRGVALRPARSDHDVPVGGVPVPRAINRPPKPWQRVTAARASSTETARSSSRRANGSEEPRLWRLANVSELRISEETFERDPDFDLERYAKRSFGTFQEEPVEVVLRFDAAAVRDASTFVFHSDRSIDSNDDGSLTVRFEAGGIDEMCWHLFTWGESVTIEKPARLRRRLAEMSESSAEHHGN